MNIFKYLKEEQTLVEGELAELVNNFRKQTREENFDGVKLICDKLRAYCKKQLDLLLDKIDQEPGYKTDLENTNSKRAVLLSDLNDLEMVHVDEPGYYEYLVNLLNHTREFYKASEALYEKLEQAVSSQALGKIDADLQDVIHSGVGFNTLPAS